jgi:rRNA maturation RNase YbeY
MPVFVRSYVRRLRLNTSLVLKLGQRILSAVGESSSELGLTFVGDRRMRRLNREFRGKDRTTDVLAFALREAKVPGVRQRGVFPLGDVVISLPTAQRQARRENRPVDVELAALLVHGVLHLCGYDHERNTSEAMRMRRMEGIVLRRLGKPHRVLRGPVARMSGR